MRLARRLLVLVTLAALAAAGTPALAQDTLHDSAAARRVDARARGARRARDQRKVDYIPASRLAEARARAISAGSQGAPVHVAPDQETAYRIVVRTDTSLVEQHARWDDLVIVRAGRGVVAMGERADQRRMLGPGEYRGGTLVGAHQLRLAVGDVVRVPAGVPHAFWPDGAAPFEYLVVKIRRAERPLEPR